jgi:hypothetical protein
MPADERERKLLSPEEKAFIDHMAIYYAPLPMTPAQRVAFDRALEARLVRQARVYFPRPVAVLATACAALVLWLAAPYLPLHSPDGMKQLGAPAVSREGTTPPTDEATLLAYAYYSDEFYGEESEKEQESFLPDEYEALAVAFALPDT